MKTRKKKKKSPVSFLRKDHGAFCLDGTILAVALSETSVTSGWQLHLTLGLKSQPFRLYVHLSQLPKSWAFASYDRRSLGFSLYQD